MSEMGCGDNGPGRATSALLILKDTPVFFPPVDVWCLGAAITLNTVWNAFLSGFPLCLLYSCSVVNLSGWESADELSGSYLLILVLRGCHVQLKGLLDQPSLPLSLPLRAVRRESGAVMLISSVRRQQSQRGSDHQEQLPVVHQKHI